jgi:hypothetical protein
MGATATAIDAVTQVVPAAVASPIDAARDGSAPALEASGAGFTSSGTAVSVTAGEQATDGIELAAPGGDLRLTPLAVSAGAADGTLVGGGSVVYAGTARETDTVVRPTETGVETFTGIRGAAAPERFRYRVTLGDGEHLAKLASGGVAVVRDAEAPAATTATQAPVNEAGAAGLPAEPLTGDVPAREPDGPETTGRVIAVVPPTWATDAEGHRVPTSLDVDGDVLTVTVKHRDAATSYPVVADPQLQATGASGDVTTGGGSTALPTWRNLYDWPGGHGFVGIDPNGDRSLYSFAAGLPSGPGAWVWPSGGHTYPSGAAAWDYVAPGTTRALRATVQLAYPPRLLSHHCIAVSLFDAGGAERNATRFCRPPQPPTSNPAVVDLQIADRQTGSPATKRVSLRIELPCAKATGCTKTIPVADAVNDGLQIRSLDMTLVDDDAPVLRPSGAFWDLRDHYIDGKQTYPLTVAASDAGAGLTRTGFEEPAVGESYHYNPTCDPTHKTPALGARICPPDASTETVVDTRPMPEGKHLFRETAQDLAGNLGATAPWAVLVDRTPPAAPKLQFTTPDEGSAQATWEPSVDPDLVDGNPGSGLAGYRIRSRVGDGAWSDWQQLGADAQISDEIFDQPDGTPVAFEAVAIDAVGNLSDVAAVSGQVVGDPPVIEAEPLGALDTDFLGSQTIEFPATFSDGGSGVRRAWMTVDGGGPIERAAGCTSRSLPDGRPYKDSCPAVLGTTFTLDGSQLSEGSHTVVLAADDRAHNHEEQTYDVRVDRTAPSAPTDVGMFGFDGEEGTVGLEWQEGEDPDLIEGTPGSGIARTEYRLLRAGAWSDWIAPDDDVTIDGTYAGEQIGVQLRSIDEAGNTSPTVERSFTISEDLPQDPGLADAALIAESATSLFSADAQGDLLTARAFSLEADADTDPAATAASTISHLGPDCRLRTAPSFRKVGARLQARFGGGCEGKNFATVQARIVLPGADCILVIFCKDKELAVDRVNGPREGFYNVQAETVCRHGTVKYQAQFLLTAPAPSDRSELYQSDITRRWTCSGDDDVDLHPCLKPGAAYHAFTRSEFKYNLCVATGLFYSGRIAQAHHIFPVAFESTFRRRYGINIHDPIYGAWWRQPDHAINAYAYNRDWQRFLGASPRPSFTEVLDHGCELADKHHLSVRFGCAGDHIG